MDTRDVGSQAESFHLSSFRDARSRAIAKPQDPRQLHHELQNRHRPQHGERYPARTLRKLTMFVKKRDFPKLRGKAGQIRGLGDAMIALWKRYGDLHTRDGIRIKLLLELSLQCDEILDSHSPADGYWALPPPNAAELVRKQRLLGQLYVQLSESYAAQEVRVFNMSAKLH